MVSRYAGCRGRRGGHWGRRAPGRPRLDGVHLQRGARHAPRHGSLGSRVVELTRPGTPRDRGLAPRSPPTAPAVGRPPPGFAPHPPALRGDGRESRGAVEPSCCLRELRFRQQFLEPLRRVYGVPG